jgi:hypothetical protein
MQGRAAVADEAGPVPAAPPAADAAGVLQQLLTAGGGLAAASAYVGATPRITDTARP